MPQYGEQLTKCTWRLYAFMAWCFVKAQGQFYLFYPLREDYLSPCYDWIRAFLSSTWRR